MPNQKTDDRGTQQGNTGGNPNQGQGQQSGQGSQSGNRSDDMGNQGQQSGANRGGQQGQENTPNRGGQQGEGQQGKVSSDRDLSSLDEDKDTEGSEKNRTSDRDNTGSSGMSNR